MHDDKSLKVQGQTAHWYMTKGRCLLSCVGYVAVGAGLVTHKGCGGYPSLQIPGNNQIAVNAGPNFTASNTTPI